MSIVSSTFAIDAHSQPDGSKWCKESHTDSDGRVMTRIYRLPAGQGATEAQAIMDAYVPSLGADLAQQEFLESLDVVASIQLGHQTGAEFAARFWERLRGLYIGGNRLEFARLIWWLHARVVAGDFTSNDVRLTFNTAYNRSLTLAQWNAFVANTLAPIKDRYQAMLDQVDL